VAPQPTDESAVSTPQSEPTAPGSKGKRKPCKDFSRQDLDQLLRAVINVNPYMAACNKVGEQWKAVARKVQAEGFCKGKDLDTLKNKVNSLLQWVQVSGATVTSKYQTNCLSTGQ
jgi:hypothetical protein